MTRPIADRIVRLLPVSVGLRMRQNLAEVITVTYGALIKISLQLGGSYAPGLLWPGGLGGQPAPTRNHGER
jgi:hypothetical protein